MDMRFISPGILRLVTGTPELAVRLDRTSCDESGDGMVLLCGRTLFLVERKLGAFEYQAKSVELKRLRLISSDPKSAVIEHDGGRWTWRWSMLDGEGAAKLLAAIAPAADRASGSATATDGGLSWATLFVAGLMYAADADGELPESQEQMVRQLSPPEALRSGVAFYTAHELGGFAALVREKCSAEQKLSLLANQLEVMMVDGLFRRKERTFGLEFANQIGIDGATFRALEQYIILKNQYNALFPADQTIEL